MRLASMLAVLVAAAVCAAPASAATDWRTAGNEICIDYYDALAVFSSEQGDEAMAPEVFIGLARLTERKDARLGRLRPPAPLARPFAQMLGHDRASARTLRELARLIRGGHGKDFEKLINRYEHDATAAIRLASKLRLPACAGGGDAVTGPAVEL